MIAWSHPFRMRLPITKCVVCKHRIWRGDDALTTMNTDRVQFAHLMCVVSKATGGK